LVCVIITAEKIVLEIAEVELKSVWGGKNLRCSVRIMMRRYHR